ncbi:MAG: hypothetical protein M1812_002309 [Candelaria pacifica]|nr:MAG: hypothetical protein M1812_002309 [Candelaria pacifica]
MFEAARGGVRRETQLGEDTKVYESRGTPYPVTQEEIDVIQDRWKLYTVPPSWMSKHRARQLLVDAHARGVHLNKHQLAAMDRLQALSELTRWGSDIAIKAFNDLDKIFFMGVLRGNVYLRWTDKSERETSAGVTILWRRQHRIVIELTTRVLNNRLATLRDVWATLLHEMIHAYLYQQCGPYLEDHDDEVSGNHGPVFRACMEAIQYRIGNPKFIQLILQHSITERPDCFSEGGYRRHGDRDEAEENDQDDNTHYSCGNCGGRHRHRDNRTRG